jgi:ABC-type spermidine/putrescine transport system permease subunit II
MNSARIGLAFLVSPLIAPIAAIATYSLNAGRIPPFRAAFAALLQYGGLAYLATVVLGIPAFFWLRSSRWRGKLVASLCGAAMGFIIAIILFGLVPGWTVRDLVVGYSAYALVGAICALTFWLVSYGTERKAPGSADGKI